MAPLAAGQSGRVPVDLSDDRSGRCRSCADVAEPLVDGGDRHHAGDGRADRGERRDRGRRPGDHRPGHEVGDGVDDLRGDDDGRREDGRRSDEDLHRGADRSLQREPDLAHEV
ncbi:unnamed protein product, partial [Penicillium discolor]